MTPTSRIYVGHVVHRRLRPTSHILRYRCFWLLLDLDELAQLGRTRRLFGYNRPAPVSFHGRDHGDGKTGDLRSYVEARLADAGIELGGGGIRLLCMPRIAGYGFNPLSIFFCYGAHGALRALIWEVNNTFGERHSYLAEVTNAPGTFVTQHCAKSLFVSPFMDQDLTYDFRVSGPSEEISVVIRTNDANGPVLLASLSGAAREFTDATLLGLLFRQPFLTLKVTAAIHWEALKLWLKGVGLRQKPPPPKSPVTVVRGEATSPADTLISASK
jgi:uncharacterized protein